MALREHAFVSLFSKLTGMHTLQPPHRYAAEDARALLDEALCIHRRSGQAMDGQSGKLRVWIFGRPDALAPRPILGHNFIEKPQANRRQPSRPARMKNTLAFGSSTYSRSGPVPETAAIHFYRPAEELDSRPRPRLNIVHLSG